MPHARIWIQKVNCIALHVVCVTQLGHAQINWIQRYAIVKCIASHVVCVMQLDIHRLAGYEGTV